MNPEITLRLQNGRFPKRRCAPKSRFGISKMVDFHARDESRNRDSAYRIDHFGAIFDFHVGYERKAEGRAEGGTKHRRYERAHRRSTKVKRGE